MANNSNLEKAHFHIIHLLEHGFFLKMVKKGKHIDKLKEMFKQNGVKAIKSCIESLIDSDIKKLQGCIGNSPIFYELIHRCLSGFTFELLNRPEGSKNFSEIIKSSVQLNEFNDWKEIIKRFESVNCSKIKSDFKVYAKEKSIKIGLNTQDMNKLFDTSPGDLTILSNYFSNKEKNLAEQFEVILWKQDKANYLKFLIKYKAVISILEEAITVHVRLSESLHRHYSNKCLKTVLQSTSFEKLFTSGSDIIHQDSTPDNHSNSVENSEELHDQYKVNPIEDLKSK